MGDSNKSGFSSYDSVLWDFNGTIIDDVGVGIECANALLRRRGLPLITGTGYYRSVFGFPIVDYYKRLGFDFTRESYADLAVEWVAEYMSREGSAPVNPGVRELIALLREKGTRQFILSATEADMLCGQLERRNMTGEFESIIGNDNIHAASKTALAVEWRRKNPASRALLIGDTDHDAAVAAAAQIDCVLVACGHQPRAVLETAGVAVLDDITSVLGLFKQSYEKKSS